MTNWEGVDHPLALMFPEPGAGAQAMGGGSARTQALALFTLNRSSCIEYISKELAAEVKKQFQMDLDKDWSKVGDAEGRSVIARLAGVIRVEDLGTAPGLRSSYDRQEALCARCRVEDAAQAPPGCVGACMLFLLFFCGRAPVCAPARLHMCV